MNDLVGISTIARILVADYSSPGTYIDTYTTTPIFTVDESNVNTIVDVLINGHSSGVTYTVAQNNTQITITSTLNVGDIVEIDYTFYANWSNTEIQNYVQAALVHMSVNNIKTYNISDSDQVTLYPEPTDGEVNLIALIASILMKPENISYRMPDIAVQVPKDLNTIDKIRKVISMYKKDGSGQFFLAEDIYTNWNYII